MRDKKKLIILSVFIVIIIVFITFLIIKKNHIDFHLNGSDTITIKYGETFVDPGFISLDGFGNDLSDKVTVTNNINSSVSGFYKVTYELSYGNKKEVLERSIIVKNMTIDNLEIRLNGNSEVFVLKDNKYIDEGAYIFNKVDNSNLANAYINVSSNVDTNVVGKYLVNYSFNYENQTISITRNVEVFDIDYELTPKDMTTKNVTISLNINGVSGYSNTRLPDYKVVTSKYVDYEVDSNGDYNFVITINDKEYIKEIKVDNIVGNYNCSGEISSIGTKIMINPVSNNIREYRWILSNETVVGNNIYSKDKLINNASVELTFDNGKSYKVDCKIEDKLLYHFKYDENNTKPFMKGNTYTSADRERLDALLKQVVNEAGYGTRAGVVAAARFIVGGLDYKVPYQGGKYYNKIGLNIGQKGAWGSSGSGIDCYSFVAWARKQNGLSDDSFYSGKKYNTYDEVNNIKVGDYLLTPCTSSVCKNAFKINHIALVIGIDDSYIYVAEATTGNINALVVSKLDKRNLPKKGGLSLVKHVSYTSEGNVTNMWIG